MNTPGLVSSLLLWISMVVYTETLPHARHGKQWMAAALPLLFFINHIKMGHLNHFLPILLFDLLGYICCAYVIYRSTKLDRNASIYCAIWVSITTYSAYEIWLLLLWVFDPSKDVSTTQLIVGQIAFTIAFYLLVRFTTVQMLPLDSGSHVGPLQLGSGLILWVIFTVQFQILMSMYHAGEAPVSRRVFITLLIQLYCPAILGGQNALFRKSALDKELETITALYEHQRSQYQTARRNVQLINKRCHDLKLQLAAVRQYLPKDFPAQNWAEAERAVSIVDRCANTGNEVLDTVLTEKALDCETRSIHINTVADGKALDFMDAADLYALFSGILDGLISIASRLEDIERRQIDTMVFARQGFAVIHVITALLPEEVPPESARSNSAEHKVIEKIVKKYDGIFMVEQIEKGICIKIVLPMPQ